MYQTFPLTFSEKKGTKCLRRPLPPSLRRRVSKTAFARTTTARTSNNNNVLLLLLWSSERKSARVKVLLLLLFDTSVFCPPRLYPSDSYLIISFCSVLFCSLWGKGRRCGSSRTRFVMLSLSLSFSFSLPLLRRWSRADPMCVSFLSHHPMCI